MESKEKKIILRIVSVIAIFGVLIFISFFFCKKERNKEQHNNSKTGISFKTSFENSEFITLKDKTVYIKQDGKIVLKTLNNEEKEKTEYTDIRYDDSEFMIYIDNDKKVLKNADHKILAETTGKIKTIYDSVTKKSYYQIDDVLYDCSGNKVLSLQGGISNINNGLLKITTNQYEALIDLDTMTEYRMYDDDYSAFDGTHTFIDIVVIRKNNQYYIYRKSTKTLEPDAYTKVTRYGDGYILSNSSKEIYLHPKKGAVSKEELKIDKLGNNYYLEHSNDDCFYLKDKNGNKVNNTCLGPMWNVSSVDKNWYLLYNVIIFPNEKVLQVDKNARFIGEYLFAEKEGIYDKNGQLINTGCLLDFQLGGNQYSCSDGAYYHFLNEKMEMLVNAYDSISCHENGYCVVEKDGQKGLWYKGNMIIEPSYFDIEIENNEIVLLTYSGFDLLVIGEDKEIPVSQLQKLDNDYDDIDIEEIIREYGLESIQDSIEQEKELFQKYALITLQNKKIAPYEKNVLKLFKVIVDNKEYLDENSFLSKLKQLNITIEKNLPIGLGGFYDRSSANLKIAKAYKSKDYVIYHELLHFVDDAIDEYKENVYYYHDKFLSKEEFIELPLEERKKALQNNFALTTTLAEGATEFYQGIYFRNGAIKSYQDIVMAYEALIYILGYDTMKDIYFSKFGYSKLLNLFVSIGKTRDDYQSFLAGVNELKYTHEAKLNLQLLDTLVDLYIANKGINWTQDNEFCYILSLIYRTGSTASSKYQKEYMEIVKRYDDSFLQKVLDGTNYSATQDAYYFTDGKKSYIMMRKGYSIFKIEYDFQKNRVIHIDVVSA